MRYYLIWKQILIVLIEHRMLVQLSIKLVGFAVKPSIEIHPTKNQLYQAMSVLIQKDGS